MSLEDGAKTKFFGDFIMPQCALGTLTWLHISFRCLRQKGYKFQWLECDYVAKKNRVKISIDDKHSLKNKNFPLTSKITFSYPYVFASLFRTNPSLFPCPSLNQPEFYSILSHCSSRIRCYSFETLTLNLLLFLVTGMTKLLIHEPTLHKNCLLWGRIFAKRGIGRGRGVWDEGR